MRATQFTVRDLHDAEPEFYENPEWDVIALCDDGSIRHTDGVFDSAEEAQEFADDLIAQAPDDLEQWTVVATAART